jgi:hypothetical protein
MMAGEIEYENFIYENGEALYPFTGHTMILIFTVLVTNEHLYYKYFLLSLCKYQLFPMIMYLLKQKSTLVFIGWSDQHYYTNIFIWLQVSIILMNLLVGLAVSDIQVNKLIKSFISLVITHSVRLVMIFNILHRYISIFG